MGISNLVVKAADRFPQSIPGLISRRNRRTKQTVHVEHFPLKMTVGELTASTRSLPGKAILLGHCADGLPFLMSMDTPEIGAILVSGNRGCGKTHQLQVMADAAMRTNKPHELQITVLTHNPSEWAKFQNNNQNKKFLQGIFAWYEPVVEEHIQRLTEISEGRRRGGSDQPANLVILDDLNFVEILSSEAQVNLRWLLEYGTQSRVWTVGALNASHVEGFPFWCEVFRTRIFGWTEAGLRIDFPGQKPGLCPETLEPGTFRAWTGDRWITYQLPLLGDGITRRI
ncbi:MAG: hypothetical protein ACOCYU_06035 [Brevefilum sp.]